MSRYLNGKSSTNKQIMTVQPLHLKAGQKDTTIRSEGGRLCLPSTQSVRGADKPAVSSNPPAVGSQQKKITEISLRKRLIHLLAIKPYTKAELFDRVMREGIDHRERCVLIMILKQLTYSEEDIHYLRSCFQDEIQGDWPYYNEEEQAIFNKRKPQSLTPCSSDGSSGSRQSSVDPGAPPSIRPPTPRLIYRRLGHHQYNGGVLTKKPRIRPYIKPVAVSNDNATSSFADKERTADSMNNNNRDQQGVRCAASNVSNSRSGGTRSNDPSIKTTINTSKPSLKRKKSVDKEVQMLVSIPIKKIKIDSLRNGVKLSR